ncbi:glycosyltransferase family 4 protein [Brevundimonas balnearis]|uniref:Glycosyltransferase family 4 protein n=1 Tax=Brevundimonas balnearis TaxID=1572858 RepID=A0ABV6R174_9CAUL
MPEVCVDGFNLSIPKGSGIATYGRNLLKAYGDLGWTPGVLHGPAHLGGDGLLRNISLLDAPQGQKPLPKLERWARTLRSPLGRRASRVDVTGEVIRPPDDELQHLAQRHWAAARIFELSQRSQRAYGRFTPLKFDGGGPDIAHWTCPLPIWAPGRVNLLTLHDIIPIRLPYTTTDDKHRYVELCRESAKRADHILAVSETTRRDAINLLGIEPGRITTTYQSVSLPDDILAMDDEALERELGGVFDLRPRSYFLFFGALEPKKNVRRLLEAYLTSGVQAPLVVVGGRAWLDGGEATLLSAAATPIDHVRRGRVIQYDFLGRGLLLRLIRGARATLFPSLYEGFGLPALESMALGTPVIASTEGSLPEVVGDAGVLVDPYAVEALREAITRMDADEDLRSDLALRGPVRARMFSPEAHRERLRDVLDRVGA